MTNISFVSSPLQTSYFAYNHGTFLPTNEIKNNAKMMDVTIVVNEDENVANRFNAFFFCFVFF